jgi:hypothetical protein
VTGWGLDGRPWDATTRQLTTGLSGLIVRTVDGDGTRAPYPGETYIYPHPDRIRAEIMPWVALKPRVIVEIGNEPNAYANAPTDAPWVYAHWLKECARMIQHEFPSVRILAPGLIERDQPRWWEIWRDQGVGPAVDGIGYHAYAHVDFSPTDTGQIQRAHQQLGQFFHDRSWWLTECGINDPQTSDQKKCERYSDLHRNMPSDVVCCCWYHVCTNPINTDQTNYSLDLSALPALQSGGRIP